MRAQETAQQIAHDGIVVDDKDTGLHARIL
jgi:hypothetical protein